MGGCFSKNRQLNSDSSLDDGGSVVVKAMFDRFDKERKGYISKKNLQDLMRNDQTTLNCNHIMEKYGTDGQLNYEQFKTWWCSTYTTYNDDATLDQIVEEVKEELQEQRLPPIGEMSEVRNSNVAVSRS
jgi:hypothetical protein